MTRTITCISCKNEFVKSKKGGLMEMFHDMKYCLICVRYDYWYHESLRNKFIKIKKRKGIEYLTITKAGILDGIKEGHVERKMTDKEIQDVVDKQKNTKITVKDFKKNYVEHMYAKREGRKYD